MASTFTDTSGTRYSRAWDMASSTSASTGGEYIISYDDAAQIIHIQQVQKYEELHAPQPDGPTPLEKRTRQRRQWGVDSRRELTGRGGPQGLAKHRKWMLAVRRG